MGKYKHSKGVSLIEVLVAVIILAFGLLGLAGLQSVSLRNNNSAMLRTQATYLAQDIVDRMRVNKTAAIDDMSYEQPMANAIPAVAANSPLDVIDRNAWLTAIGNALPSGDGEIDCIDASDVCQITIQWNDRRDLNNLQEFITSTQL
jgi:type IV pilus assembly protein PilV